MEYEALKDALDGIYAYDTGCVDSGIHDELLRQRCIDYLNSLSEEEQRVLLSRIMRDLCLTDEAIAQGYGWEDAKSFGYWLEDMG